MATQTEPRWVTHYWLDGAKTAEWLLAWVGREYPDKTPTLVLGESTMRDIRRWIGPERQTPSVWHVDKILTRAGLHLSDLPDEVWLDKRPPLRIRQPLDSKIRRKALALVAEGLSIRAVARECDVADRTVRNWIKADA